MAELTFRPLPTQIHQFRNPLPARPSTRRVLALFQELLGLLAGTRDLLLFLAVVIFVEIVDVLAGAGAGLLGFFGFFFVLAVETLVARFAPAAVGEGRGVSYGE